jgi:hypothetical protein
MAIYRIDQNQLVAVPVTNFASQDIRERQDLQRLLKAQIEVLDPNLMVLAEEFGDWEDSARRIDLLCLDRDANLVVVELKRTQDGGHMELQALRYAAMVSTMTFEQMLEAHARYLDPAGDRDAARSAILDFLGWDEVQEEDFAQDVRIILASADFGKELTTAVLWLNDRGLDIRCVRLKPHTMSDGTKLLDVQQVIPLPEATEYQTRVSIRDRVTRERRTGRHELSYRFWEALLALASTKTQLHAGRAPVEHHWIGGSSGVRGIGLHYATKEDASQAELYIDFTHVPDRAARNLEVFHRLEAQRPKIEAAFGGPLEWQELPGKVACRIRKRIQGGYQSPEPDWPRIHGELVDTMIRLHAAFQPVLQNLPA